MLSCSTHLLLPEKWCGGYDLGIKRSARLVVRLPEIVDLLPSPNNSRQLRIRKHTTDTDIASSTTPIHLHVNLLECMRHCSFHCKLHRRSVAQAYASETRLRRRVAEVQPCDEGACVRESGATAEFQGAEFFGGLPKPPSLPKTTFYSPLSVYLHTAECR